MNRSKVLFIIFAFVTLLLVSCSDPNTINLVMDGNNIVLPGEQVEIFAEVGEEITELSWQLSDHSMGILAVSSENPNKAIFTASKGVFGSVIITASSDVNSDSIEFIIGELNIAGSRAWNFARQGGGEVQSPDNRGYGSNTVISHWNHGDHWLEWDLTVPKAGEYALILRYATVRDPHLTKRELKVNGEVVIPVMTFNNTGGYAGPESGTDVALVSHWDTAVFAGIDLEAGTQSIRLTHIGDEPAGSNGTNLAYLALVSLGDLELIDSLLLLIESEIGVQRELRHWN